MHADLPQRIGDGEGATKMGFNNNFENSYTPNRSYGADPAARVAQEIFQHNLSGAAADTKNFVHQMPAEYAQQFVRNVNRDLQMLKAESNFYGDQSCASNYLDIHSIWKKDGTETEVISMKSTDGKHAKNIAEVPVCPAFSRVPQQNFQPYQWNEPTAPGYYGQSNGYGWGPFTPPIAPTGYYGNSGFYGSQGYYNPQPVGYSGQWIPVRPAVDYYRPGNCYGTNNGYYHHDRRHDLDVVAGVALGSIISRIKL